MNDNIASLRDRAADAVADTKERVREIATMRVETSVARSALGTLVLVVGFVVTGFVWTKYVRWDERRDYRDRIAAASPRVREAMRVGGKDATDLDEIVIKAVGGTDDKLTDAEDRMSTFNNKPPLADTACRIPAHCLAGGGVR